MSIFIEFRGNPEVEIDYRDHGYEPDTNAHEIEWWFVDPVFEAVTDEENEAVMKLLYELSMEPDCDYDELI